MTTSPSPASTVPRTIGFVGVGTMGAPIARRLLGAGHTVRVADRSPDAADVLVDDGAERCDHPEEVAAGAHTVFCSLPGPDEVRTCVVGDHGVLATDPLPRFVVDLSTNEPATVRDLATRCDAAGVTFVDAPVSGGAAKAVTGELSVMLGARADAVPELDPLLRSFATEVFHVGDVGTGTVAKLVNNQLFLAGEVLVQEAYLLAAAHGLDPADLHEVVRASSGGTYAALAPLLLSRRFDDVIFRLDIAAKDLRLARDAARDAGVDVPTTEGALTVFEAAVAAGHGGSVFHATLLELEQRAGIAVPPLVRRRRAS